MRRPFLILVLLTGVTALGWAIAKRIPGRESVGGAAARPPVPVEVAPIERGPIRLRRTFSGALEAAAEMLVAPKVAGRLERVAVDIGDAVQRGQIVAWLDDAEFVQSAAQAEADLAVARANLSEAQSALEIAARALQRFETLRQQGVTSEQQYDAAQADDLAKRAHVAVTAAQVTRAEAGLEAARIRLGYTQVVAGWSGGDDERVVAERFVDEGGNVSANTPVLAIVELDPIVGVVYVPERDYARLFIGQTARLVADGYPGEAFEGQVERIAPVFRRTTRQARVELAVANPDRRLKPGMFVRATIELERVDAATLVPYLALTEREGQSGVFVVDAEGATGATVAWRPVEVGIREGEQVEVRGAELSGRVVTLGQQLCDDGSAVSIQATR